MTEESLTRQLRALRAYAYCSSAVIAVLVVAGFRAQSTFDVVRAKGIVIEDADGRDRILIGAPIPTSKDRVRDDFEKVVKAWGPRYGGKMDWFKKVENATTGIVVLNDKGYDRLTFGDPQPDPNIGPRIDRGPGLVINDNEGFERAGMGYFDKLDQVGLGLDRPGGEGTGLVVSKDGTAGAWFNGTNGESGFVGASAAKSMFNSSDKGFLGVIVQRGDKTVHRAGTAATGK